MVTQYMTITTGDGSHRLMAHFAKLDENNVVLSVHVVNNDVITDENGDEQESLGVCILKGLLEMIQRTSYNANVEVICCNAGNTLHAEKDKFRGSCRLSRMDT